MGEAPPNFLEILNGAEEEGEQTCQEEDDTFFEPDFLDTELLETEYLDARPMPTSSRSWSRPLPHAPSTGSPPVVSSRDRSRSPLRGDPDAAVDPDSPPVLEPLNVVVTVLLDDDNNDSMETDHAFHLSDEHRLFQQVEDVAAEEPLPQRRPGRGGTVRARGRGRGARGRPPVGDPQLISGEKLMKVYVDDDDVPEDLREAIVQIVNAREAARARLAFRERREREENEEEFVNADDAEVESFFAAEGTSNQFEWSANMADFRGEREIFLPQQTGAVVASETAYEAFRQFWDEDMLEYIVTATNRYAAELVSSSAYFARDWYDTNVHEILVLFSFWMMLGIIPMPSISSCFTTNPLLQTNVFKRMFSRNRYVSLCRAFQLNDISSRPTDSTDIRYSLGPIADRLNVLFQQAYIPSQNIAIDESLTLWKCNLPFRQYIKTKAAQSGVKTFELCESSTGYLWSFFIYRGAGSSHDSNLPPTTQKSTSTVLQLIKPLLNKGYTLFMDSWFNSPLLARFLKTRKTDCVGTLRANRTDVPPLLSLCKLKDGQFVARHSGDVVVLAFQDKKRKIATISTYHGDSQGRTEAKPHRPSLYKPSVALDYNRIMGGVDRKDLMLEPNLLERKRGNKWNFMFFKHLLNCSVFNARILLQSSTATPKEQIVFRLELVDQILELHHQHVPTRCHRTHPVSSSLGHPRPQVQHFPRQTDQLETNGRRRRWRCHKCKRKTTFTCSACEVSLCTDPCFELYHTS